MCVYIYIHIYIYIYIYILVKQHIKGFSEIIVGEMIVKSPLKTFVIIATISITSRSIHSTVTMVSPYEYFSLRSTRRVRADPRQDPWGWLLELH